MINYLLYFKKFEKYKNIFMNGIFLVKLINWLIDFVKLINWFIQSSPFTKTLFGLLNILGKKFGWTSGSAYGFFGGSKVPKNDYFDTANKRLTFSMYMYIKWESFCYRTFEIFKSSRSPLTALDSVLWLHWKKIPLATSGILFFSNDCNWLVASGFFFSVVKVWKMLLKIDCQARNLKFGIESLLN